MVSVAYKRCEWGGCTISIKAYSRCESVVSEGDSNLQPSAGSWTPFNPETVRLMVGRSLVCVRLCTLVSYTSALSPRHV